VLQDQRLPTAPTLIVIIPTLERVAYQANLILESFRQLRAAWEPVECLAHLVRCRNQVASIAPVKEIKLIRLLANGLDGAPLGVAFSYPLRLPKCHIAPAERDAQISRRLGHPLSLSTMRPAVFTPGIRCTGGNPDQRSLKCSRTSVVDAKPYSTADVGGPLLAFRRLQNRTNQPPKALARDGLTAAFSDQQRRRSATVVLSVRVGKRNPLTASQLEAGFAIEFASSLPPVYELVTSMIKRALTRKLGLDMVRLPLVYLIMATPTKPQPLNPKALAVWAAAPLAVAGVIWLADRAALWGLGLWAVWVGIGILAPLPGLRRAWRRPAQVRPAQARPPAVKAPGMQRNASPWAGPVKRQPQPPVVVDRQELEAGG
jgi:hypothetical protein